MYAIQYNSKFVLLVCCHVNNSSNWVRLMSRFCCCNDSLHIFFRVPLLNSWCRYKSFDAIIVLCRCGLPVGSGMWSYRIGDRVTSGSPHKSPWPPIKARPDSLSTTPPWLLSLATYSTRPELWTDLLIDTRDRGPELLRFLTFVRRLYGVLIWSELSMFIF